jgi:transcriptional regulator with XRE-family HTH domain
MIQPELGKYISQLRNSQGLTQQELADQCKLNIRTIQRIEAGEVVPRIYTLNLLTKSLKMDMNQINSTNATEKASVLKLKTAFTGGIIYCINGILVVYDLITHKFNPGMHLATTLIHIISCVLFFAGFYRIGMFYHNKLLYISSLMMMILLPSINILDLLKKYYFSIGEIFIFIIMCLNIIVLGVGLLKESFERKGYENGSLYQITGVLTIIISVLYLSLHDNILYAGLILSIPSNLLMVYILSKELADPQKQAVSTAG